jgi:hypothetical protein
MKTDIIIRKAVADDLEVIGQLWQEFMDFHRGLWSQTFKIRLTIISNDAIKRIEGRLDKESQLREKIEFLKGRIVPEF